VCVCVCVWSWQFFTRPANPTRKNRVWVCYNRVRVIIGLTWLWPEYNRVWRVNPRHDYDPIARVDPITRLPANTIITRLRRLTRQHDYNPIKEKNWRLKHVKTVKLIPCRVGSGKRVTRFLVGFVVSCSGYPIINRVVFGSRVTTRLIIGSGSGWHVYIIGSVGLTRTWHMNPNCQPCVCVC
jgi:hypothetical protein